MPLADTGNLLVISPHLDDAVFACGDLLAREHGALVLTVFAGVPEKAAALTQWDAASGCTSARQALQSRRQEDRDALGALRAVPLWLDFCDSQYDATPELTMLEDALAKQIEQARPDSILLPAGLFHSDHVLVHDAMLHLRARYADRVWLMYEEPSYRRIPGLLQQRLYRLLKDGVRATPEPPACAASQRKRDAVHRYASQLRALERTVRGGYADVFEPERYWRLDTFPAAERGP